MTVYPTLVEARFSHMKSGDIFDTLGQFNPDGFGAARYYVKTLQEWRDDPFAGLPADWEVTEHRREAVTVANGLVARLICDFSPEHQKVASYGYNLIGDQKYGTGVIYRFETQNDVVKQADGGYDQYFSFISLPQVVSGDYTNDGRSNVDTGRIYFDMERATWRHPIRFGEIRMWFCQSDNLHYLYGREPTSVHDGNSYFVPDNKDTADGGDIPPDAEHD